MPILEIEIVTRPGESLRPSLAAELAQRAGKVFASPLGGTWVRLHPLPAEYYAENRDGPEMNPFPVFVSVLKAGLPRPAEMQAEVRSLSEVIAELCSRPVENVHILYLPQAAGRLAFGGILVT